MKKFLLMFLLLITFIVSCYVAPTPIFRLQTEPHQNESIWLHGKEYSRLVNNDVDIFIAFDEVRNNIASFDVEVLNHSSEPIIISSELFKAYYFDEKKKELKNNTYHFALNPENQILEIDKQLSRENSRYSQEMGNKALTSIVDLATAIVTIGAEKTHEELEKESQERTEKEVQNINDENYHTRSISSLSKEKDIWSFSALRKTTLPQNYNLKGKIFFPLIPDSHFMKIVFDEEKENLNIMFKVNKYKP